MVSAVFAVPLNILSSLLTPSSDRRSLNSGWGGRIRTFECRCQRPVPYHLATPQSVTIPQTFSGNTPNGAMGLQVSPENSCSTQMQPAGHRPRYETDRKLWNRCRIDLLCMHPS